MLSPLSSPPPSLSSPPPPPSLSSPQDLLYRRMRSLANYEAANKKLETAKTKNKGLPEAETNQQTCKTKFDKLSETGKQGMWVVWWVESYYDDNESGRGFES